MPTRYTSEISHRAIDAASVLANSELLHFPPSSGAHVLCSAGKTGIATATSGWQVQTGNRYVYLLDGGRYALMGDLVNLEDGRNLTEQSRRVTAVETLSEFDDTDLVVFAARGESRAMLNVFTDTSCPYCQKLHGEIDKLQEAGITVRYFPYARGGSRGPGYQHLRSVWCAENRTQAMTDAKNQRFDDLPPGDCEAASMVDRGYLAGNKMGISGTPALIKSNGEKIEGYRPYQELIPLLIQQP
jgi:thiol:disulfide interchange protein DsbC